MNPTVETNWLPGLLMLAAGAIAALAYVFGAQRTAGEASKATGPDDLDARYQAKLAELRDHHASRHLQKADEWEATKRRLEGEAASVLKERNGLKHEKTKAAGRAQQKAIAKAKDTSITGKNPALTGALIGGAVVGFFVLLGFNLSQSTGERKGGMQAMGASSATPEQAEQRDDPRLLALGERVQVSPEDPEAVGDLAMYLVRRQAFEDARPLVDRVTQLDPYSVKGRVARAVLRAVDGDAKDSEDDLEHLSAYYPEAYDAFMFAGLIAMETNDAPRAIKNLEAYLATAPAVEQPPMMRGLIAQLKQGRVPR